MTDPSAGPLRGIRVIELDSSSPGRSAGQAARRLRRRRDQGRGAPAGRPDAQVGVSTDGHHALLDGPRPGQALHHRGPAQRPKAASSYGSWWREADVVVENFRAGDHGALGPRLRGPPRDQPRHRPHPGDRLRPGRAVSERAGYGSIGEAMGGLRYLMGDPDRPPSRFGLSLGDSSPGSRRTRRARGAARTRRTGAGQVVDVSIYESVLAMTGVSGLGLRRRRLTRKRPARILPGVAPSNVYRVPGRPAPHRRQPGHRLPASRRGDGTT